MKARNKKALDADPRIDQGAVMRQNGYLPAVDVAKQLGVSLTTIARWCDSGSVECEIIGHRRWVKLTSVVAHVGENQARLFGLIPKLVATKKKTSRQEERSNDHSDPSE